MSWLQVRTKEDPVLEVHPLLNAAADVFKEERLAEAALAEGAEAGQEQEDVEEALEEEDEPSPAGAIV